MLCFKAGRMFIRIYYKKNENWTYPCLQDQNKEINQRETKFKDFKMDQYDQTCAQYLNWISEKP